MNHPLRNRLCALALAFLLGTAGAQAQQAVLPGPGPGPALTVSVAQPNPFGITSRFALTARRSQLVRAELHNLLGQRVQTLFEGRLDAGETRVVTIQAEGLPAGLYLYRVQADREVITRQVVITR